MRIWASIPAWSRPLPRSTTMTRQGCSRLALLAATTAASASSPEATITRVSTRPRVTTPPRSEEHTSELQSRFDLVCRLLREKTKIIAFKTEDVRIRLVDILRHVNND